MSPVLCLSIYPVHSSILLLLIVVGKALPVLEAEFPGLCKLLAAHHTLPQQDLEPSGFQRMENAKHLTRPDSIPNKVNGKNSRKPYFTLSYLHVH